MSETSGGIDQRVPKLWSAGSAKLLSAQFPSVLTLPGIVGTLVLSSMKGPHHPLATQECNSWRETISNAVNFFKHCAITTAVRRLKLHSIIPTYNHVDTDTGITDNNKILWNSIHYSHVQSCWHRDRYYGEKQDPMQQHPLFPHTILLTQRQVLRRTTRSNATASTDCMPVVAECYTWTYIWGKGSISIGYGEIFQEL